MLWALTIVGLIVDIVWWAEPGQRVANRFGDDPLGGAGAPPWNPANAPVVAAAVAPTKTGVDLASLEKMAELHKAGVLTDEEFAQQKAKILGQA